MEFQLIINLCSFLCTWDVRRNGDIDLMLSNWKCPFSIPISAFQAFSWYAKWNETDTLTRSGFPVQIDNRYSFRLIFRSVCLLLNRASNTMAYIPYRTAFTVTNIYISDQIKAAMGGGGGRRMQQKEKECIKRFRSFLTTVDKKGTMMSASFFLLFLLSMDAFSWRHSLSKIAS